MANRPVDGGVRGEPASAQGQVAELTPASKQRCIAICVDDFGLHAGVNLAVLELAGLGRVNAVACMVGAPQWKAAGDQLARLESAGVEIGLHLDFTEFPLHAASRQALPRLVAAAYCAGLNEQRLRAEIEAQVQALEQALGHSPAFVDGHQHVHQLPGIRRVLIDVLEQRYRERRPWLRRTRPAPPGAAPSPGSRLRQTVAQQAKPLVIAALGAAALARLAARKGYAQNEHLLGVYDFTGDAQDYLSRLRDWLAQASDGDLLMCHPSTPCEAQDSILKARINEYEVLAGPSFQQLLSDAGVVLRPMSRMLDGH